MEKEGSGQEQLTKLIETLQKEEREKAKEKKQNKIKKTSLKKILPTSIAIQTNEQAKPKRERIPSSVKVTDLDSILEEKEMKRRSVPQTQILPPNDDIEFAPFFYGLDINTSKAKRDENFLFKLFFL